MATIAHRLELDLDVFTGPFDLLLSLILREELDLLEVELAEIVIAYIDHLEAEGELDLEAATEFLVLIAALLELKSRLMLPGDDALDELDELAPAEAAEELLERMLEYARFRGAGGWTARGRTPPGRRTCTARRRCRPRCAVCPSRSPSARTTRPCSARRSASLLRTPPPIDLRHMATPRVSVADRLAHLRGLLRRRSGRFSFDEAVAGADRVTVAVTLFALLELYKERRGRLGAGRAVRADHDPGGPHEPARRQVEALLFLAPEPVALDELADAVQAGEEAVREALDELRRRARGPRRRPARGRRRLGARLAPRRRGGRAPPAGAAAHAARSRPRRPRRWRSSATCSRSRAPRSPASAASPPSPRPPRWSSAG